jgi:hypothetical protein
MPVNPSYSGRRGRKVMSLRPAQAKVVLRLCLKNKNKRSGGIVQVVEYMLSVDKALGLIPTQHHQRKVFFKPLN